MGRLTSACAAAIVVNAFKKAFDQVGNDVSRLGRFVPLPQFPESVVIALCAESVAASERLPGVIKSSEDAIVVGDVYGNVHNIFSVFARYGFPPDSSRYIFLGNFVEMGEFSLEVAVLLLALNVVHPDKVQVLRGMSEVLAMQPLCGLAADAGCVYERTSPAVVGRLLRAFTILPYAVLVRDRVLCCQAALIARCSSVKELSGLPRRAVTLAPRDSFAMLVQSQNLMNDELVKRFVLENGLDRVVCGDASSEGCFDRYAGGLGVALSCCNADGYGCVFPLTVGPITEPVIFETVPELQREDAAFHSIVLPCPLSVVSPPIASHSAAVEGFETASK